MTVLVTRYQTGQIDVNKVEHEDNTVFTISYKDKKKTFTLKEYLGKLDYKSWK